MFYEGRAINLRVRRLALTKPVLTAALLGFMASRPAGAEGLRGHGDQFLTAACKGLVAVEFDVAPGAVRIDRIEPPYYALSRQVRVSWIRPSDGKRWRLACSEGGADTDGSTEISWATVREDNSIGRSRNDPRYDDHVRARLQGSTMTVIKTFREGGEKQVSFRVSGMQPPRQRH